jgi:hypothetical protein
MTKEEYEEAINKLSAELRKQKARCDRYCGTWNSEDRDCEIYGEYHPSPARCLHFLEGELASRNKEIKEK